MVGGEDAGRLHFGIFIKKISPGSIAHQDGRLQVGEFTLRAVLNAGIRDTLQASR